VELKWKKGPEDMYHFPAFEWRDFYVYQTSHYYFVAFLRKIATKKRMNALLRGDMIRSKPYVVTFLGAESGIAFTPKQWKEIEDPWKGHSAYLDCFYFGKKYKFEFEYDKGVVPIKGQTSSGLCHHFDTLEEATAFLEKWKEKIVIDHLEKTS